MDAAPKVVCATVAVGTAKKSGDGDALMDRIVTATYDKCRAGGGLIPSFPDFGPLLTQMTDTNTGPQADPSYQVTALHSSGALVVKEPFHEQFGEAAGENQLDEFASIIKEHNEKYKEDGIRFSIETVGNPAADARPVAQHCQVVETSEPLTSEKLAAMNLSQPQSPKMNSTKCIQTQN